MNNTPDPLPAQSEKAALYLSRYVLPLGIKADSKDLPCDKMKRANFTLVNTGERNLFLTCHHVLKGFEDSREQNCNAEIVAYAQNHNPLVELNSFDLIDRNEAIDLAVFTGPEHLIPGVGSNFHDLQKKNPPNINEGDVITVLGYPTSNLTVSSKLIDFGMMHYLVRASSVSENRIVISDEQGTHIFKDYGDSTRLESEVDLGGLSGSPAFHIDEHNCYSLVGIVTDGKTPGSPLLISRIDALNSDGSLEKSLI